MGRWDKECYLTYLPQVVRECDRDEWERVACLAVFLNTSRTFGITWSY